MIKKNSSNINEKAIVVVISGPSGVGKDATLSKLAESGAKFHYVVTATTRPKRANEIDGVDYYFITKTDFKKKIEQDEFLEYATVYGNYYGVLKQEVHDALSKGEDVILKVDVQGAATLKSRIPEAVFIFLVPPSINELSERLKRRNADSDQNVSIRVAKAEEEMESMHIFDYVIVNHRDNLAKTANKVKAIVIAEKSRNKPREVRL